MINLQNSVAFISSRCALHRLCRSIRFPSIFGVLMIFCRKTQKDKRKKRSPKGSRLESCYVRKIYGTFGVEMRAYGQKFVKFCTHIPEVTVTVFKTSRHSKLLFFVKKQRTMECKKRSKGRGWESCYVKKIYGTFGVEMRAYGQKLVKFCKHRQTHASKLVVEILQWSASRDMKM